MSVESRAAPGSASAAGRDDEATVDWSGRRGRAPWHGWDWSPARLSAAVAGARPPDRRAPIDEPLRDELEFFTAIGVRHRLSRGITLMRAGEKVRDVYLVVRGAVAEVSRQEERRPILAFTIPNELCCPVPALLHEPAPWDAVTATESLVITVPAARFSAAVCDRWLERWSTRSLSWLAAMGARMADLDCDLTGQAAALLLRHRGEASVALCRRTIADLLDVDEATVGQILVEFERLGAVRLTDGRVAVTQVEILKATVAAARSSQFVGDQSRGIN